MLPNSPIGNNGEVWFCRNCQSKYSIKPPTCTCNKPDIILYSITQDKLDQDRDMIRGNYQQIINLLKMYCDIPEEYYHILPLWILGTYIHNNFNTFPLLFINAVKGSGKSRLLNLIIALSKNGKVVSDLKESVLFRTAKGATIGIDEFEHVGSKESSTLRTLLNAAYKKGNAVERMKKVIRQGKEEYEVERFDLYTPLAMANIWGMEEVLLDRCITIQLDKSVNGAITKLIEDFDTNPKIQEIKRTSCSLCSVVTLQETGDRWNKYITDKYETTLTTYNTYSTQTTLTTQEPLNYNELEIFNKIDNIDLNGRSLEIFFPLFFIAHWIGDDILDKILLIAKKIIEDKKNEEFAESKDISLIDFVSQEPRGNYMPINDILKRFKFFISLDEEEIKWMNSKWVGRALKRTKLICQKRRTNKGIEVILDVDKAKRDILRFKEVIKKE